MRWFPLLLGVIAWASAVTQWRIATGRQDWDRGWPFVSERGSGLFFAGWNAIVGTMLVVVALV